MNLLCCLIRAFTLLLFTAFGVNVSFAAQGGWTQVNHPIVAQDLSSQSINLAFTVRATPLTGQNVEITGGVTVMQGSAVALHGQETVAALFGFGIDLVAPNRGVIPTATARTQNLRTNMNREGMRFDPGEEAHHIVARNDPRAARSRELLEEAGVNINSPANGVPLPGRRTTPNPNNKAVHRGDVIYSDGYYRYVEQELLDAPVAQRPAVIRRIAAELDRGDINWTD